MNLKKVLPKLYLDLETLGATDSSNFIAPEAITQKYLWFFNLTWLTFSEINDEKRSCFIKDKFVPFGFDNGGNYWCFDLNQNKFQPVICCYHDGGVAEFYAKTLEAALFRQILDYAYNNFEVDEIEQEKSIIYNWINRLKKYFPKEWLDELNFINSDENFSNRSSKSSDGWFTLITESKYDYLVNKYLKFELLDTTFNWTNEPEKYFK